MNIKHGGLVNNGMEAVKYNHLSEPKLFAYVLKGVPSYSMG